MYLTPQEEEILNGEHGFAKQKAMQILVALGKTYDADKLIPIKSAHVAGVSYKGLGDAGLEFLEELAKDSVTVVVPTTLNPGGVSPKMNASPEFMEKQKLIIDAYKALGITATLSCTPYYFKNEPQQGDHLSWAESSAVVYANSVIGAYTNREGGPSALAAALIGKTPNYGLHLDENRKAKICVKLEAKLNEYSEFAALGYFSGRKFKDTIVSFDFSERPSNRNLKALSVALAASGSSGMFKLEPEGEETITVEEKEIREIFENYFSSDVDPDIICLGCPHAGFSEIKELAAATKGKEVRKGLTFWVFTSEQTRKQAEISDYEKELENRRIVLISDTCMVVSPLEDLGFKCMLTNSAKAAHYARSLCKIDTKLDSLENILEYALE